MTASRGGTFRETFAIGKAYAEARKQHGASELLDEIVSGQAGGRSHALPLGRGAEGARRCSTYATRYEVLERKASADEVEGYRRFVLASGGAGGAARTERTERR